MSLLPQVWWRDMCLIALILLVFSVGCNEPKALTVADVIRDARALDGKTIHVRGQVFLWIDPSRAAMWMFGGCAINPDGTLNRQGNVTGWISLYDSIEPDDLKNYGAPHDRPGLRISDASFHCNGDYCQMTCSPFEIVSEQMYEFVGTLHVNDSALVLEDIDLTRSRHLVDGQWAPISANDFEIMFP